jgi:general secretion pathway protein M
MKKLADWYAGMQERERRMVAIGAVFVGVVVLVLGILMPLQSALSSARLRTETKREDLAWIQGKAAEVRAKGDRLPPETGEEPVVLVDRIGREKGLAAALRGTQPNGTGVRVRLEDAPFDVLITWLATLDERDGLAVEAITVDRAAKPGAVNATVTFARPHR